MAERICKMCDILKDLPQDVASYAEKLYNMMPNDEKADEELMKSRLSICESCEKRENSTCLKCGCYIQIRVLSRQSKCPAKKWK